MYLDFDAEERRVETVKQTDVFSLAGIIQFLEGQDPEQQYEYGCNGGCLLAAYFRSRGMRRIAVGGFTIDYTDLDGIHHQDVDLGKLGDVAFDDKYRFSYGAALQRARAAAGMSNG